jgi:hypothetical protein
VTHITGEVWPSLELAAVDPNPGHPQSITFTTTNFNGQAVTGLLDFTASNPQLCATNQGLTNATITGTLSHAGVQHARVTPDLTCTASATGEVCTSREIQAATGCGTRRTGRTCAAHKHKRPPRARCTTQHRPGSCMPYSQGSLTTVSSRTAATRGRPR